MSENELVRWRTIHNVEPSENANPVFVIRYNYTNGVFGMIGTGISRRVHCH